MSTLHDTARELADLCEQKRAAYGESIPKAVAILTILYPEGIQPEQYLDALIAARVAEKHARIAQGAERHGEHPRLDSAGYELMGLEYSKRKVGQQECGIASGAPDPSPDAEKNSGVPSAAKGASAQRTSNGDAPNARNMQPNSNAPSAPTSPNAAAPAPTATIAAPSVADVLGNATRRNYLGLCPVCPTAFRPAMAIQTRYLIDRELSTCTHSCMDELTHQIAGAGKAS